VDKGKFRRRVTSKGLSVSGSARPRLLAQLNTGNVAEVHRPDFISRSRLRLVEDPRMKRAPNEKGCRALTLSRLHHSSVSNSSSLRRNTVARLLQVNVSKDSRKVERRDNQKKRHSHGHNNFGAVTPAAPE
jgi:hypothetical protein